ncbi:hypothetical protein [Pseudoxanthomonas sp. CF125]|uniref:hypothetical protein n=1 Tax=Pseudoxanthomonas sp. CF125 TaxID=1855303 RepID=UPI000884E129|nr:hypothetical protein [Pseudoxanthomonas sp. CF125]SDQ22564.1 hypothetical protein SAMN05216569_0177 [Pseudoxanthomonas sp. CF125]
MRLQGAVVNEQGVIFSIVVVKESATQTSASAERARVSFQHLFPGMPIILASRSPSGRFKYQGRLDIVRFLSRTDPSRIPWKEYTVS